MLDKQNRAHFKYYQMKTHVQTTCESHDLNLDFRSFDNGFKQLCVTNFMQEYCFCHFDAEKYLKKVKIVNLKSAHFMLFYRCMKASVMTMKSVTLCQEGQLQGFLLPLVPLLGALCSLLKRLLASGVKNSHGEL